MSDTLFPLGVYVGNPNGNDPAAEAAFESQYNAFVTDMGGARPQFMDTFVDYTLDPSQWGANAAWSAWSWALTGNDYVGPGSGIVPVVGVPMASNAGGWGNVDTFYQQIIAGDYDADYKAIVDAWADEGYTTVQFRLGYEFDGNFMPWSPGNSSSPTADADFVAAFQHIANLIHQEGAADGITAQVVWNPADINWSSVDPTQLYPGNQYVDIISTDAYSPAYPLDLTTWSSATATTPGPQAASDTAWAASTTNLEHYWQYSNGDQWNPTPALGSSGWSLEDAIEFAEENDKPLSISETGAGSNGSGLGPNDDPAFVEWLASALNTAEAEGVTIQNVDIWDTDVSDGSWGFSNGERPLEEVAWGEYFGASGATTVTIDAQGNIGGFGTLTGVGTVNGTITPSGGTLDIIGSDIELGVTLDANALILVTGAGNALDTQGSPLSIGAGGSGTLLVEAAGTFTSAGGTTAAGALALGTASGGSGYVTVTDTGSVLDDAGAFIIGGSGIETDGTPQPGGLGALFITASGSVTAASADIAADPGSDGSSATVTGTGSEWTIGGSLIVGDLAAGSLAITAGGSVSAANLTVGNSTSGVGDLSVSGTTSVLSLGTQLVVGAAGIGDVAISNGATISAASGTIGADAGASGVVDIEGANSRLDISGDLDIGWGGTGVVVMGASTTLSVEGDLNIGASGQLIQFGGVIDPANVTNHGTAGGAGTLDVTGTLTNDGVYYAESGTYVMNVGTLITGSGTLEVDDGGNLVVNAGSVANTEQVSFNNDTLAAVLTIGTLGTFSGVLDNFGSLDSIVLTGTAVGSDAYTAGSGGEDGVLTLYAGPDQSGAVLGTLAVSADITMAGVAELEMVNDGTIGDPACFAAGTRIAIEQGEATVEQLREGDLVLTVDGALVPVVWIGHRRVDCRRHPRPEAVWPVRVAAGAFGPARPQRDLLLSPDHGLYFDSGKAPVLIPVRYLVNGSTIARITVDEVTYYHVELPRHDVLLAEGLPAESYLDTGDRGNFVNGGVSVTLHPDFATLVWEGRGCAPLVVTGPEVDAARAIAMPTVAWLQRCPNPDMLDEGRPSTSVPEREGDTAEESSNRYHMSPLTC